MSRSTELEFNIALTTLNVTCINGILWEPLCMSAGSERRLTGEQVASLLDDYQVDMVRALGSRTHAYLSDMMFCEMHSILPKEDWDKEITLTIRAYD